MHSFTLGSGSTRFSTRTRIRRGEIFVIHNEYTSIHLKGLAHAGQAFMWRCYFALLHLRFSNLVHK